MKQGGGFWLYLRMVVLNLAVVGMFYAVSQTPPPLTVSYISVPARLVVKQQILPIKSGIPTRLVIQSLGLDLVVGTGSYNASDGEWTLDATKAYYADVSAPSNDHNGTTLIYGHAQAPIFGDLHNLQPQSEAVVDSDTGYRFHYVYQSVQQVLPTDTSVFQENGDPNLVLQTCSGDWDAYRSLFTFKLESVDKV
jgi:sortase (surface protein transpeptidase)